MKELKAFLASGGAHLCRVLMKARQQAQGSGGDVWQSAVDVSALVRAGASVTAVEYLLAEAYAEARTETTKSGAALRSFVEGGRRAFAPGSCIVLTGAGTAFVTGLLCLAPGGPGQDRTGDRPGVRASPLDTGNREPPHRRRRRACPPQRGYPTQSPPAAAPRRICIALSGQNRLLLRRVKDGVQTGACAPLPGLSEKTLAILHPTGYVSENSAATARRLRF